jgi:large subunit ribosomal protein L23
MAIKYPLSTEKAIRLMEAENKLVFAVDRTMDKPEIKVEVETMFNVKVVSINTLIARSGNKHAYVTLAADNLAIDVATNLGLM